MLPPLGDLHRIECWLLHHGLHLKVILRPALPRHGLLYERSALLVSATEELKWRSREDSHLELPPSQGGVQNSYTSGALKNVRHAGAAPAPAVWKTAVLAVTPMTLLIVVAASGIAPDSPRLQRGANLSQLHSRGPSARYRAAVSRLSGEGSAFELRRN